MNLSGKKIVITGANGALGRVVADVARKYGAELVLLDIAWPAEAPADGAARYAVDLCDAKAVADCISEIGAFDAVVNLAGGFDMGPAVHEITDEQWSHLYRMNVVTMQNTVRASVPTLLARGRGAIVNVGALGALKGQANMGAYCGTKSVVMRFTESLSEELKNNGINVNAVLPSVIDTPRNRADMPNADFSKWVRPEQLADAICFLASDAASGIHGVLLPVAGLA
ncbi:MAG: SDR family NAD(P)-dependent oxidoreductase [Spongiibacteraceae bacterium]